MNNKEKKISGVIIPMLTPINENNKIDFYAIEKIIINFIRYKTQPFLLGTTGEGTSVSHTQKKELVKFVVNNFSSDVKIYVNIANNCVEEALENAKEFSDLGADFIVAILPYYYELTPDQMLKFFELLADNSPKPVILYNITSTTHLSIPLDIVEKLSFHPNIVAIKDSERDINRFNKEIEMFQNRVDFSHIVGWAAKSFYSLAKGSDGLVPSTGNFCPGMFQEMYDSVKNGDLKNAERLQNETDDLAKIYQKDRTLGNSLAAAKVIMHYFGFCEPYMLPPLSRLSNNEEKKIINNIEIIQNKIRIY